MNASPPPHSNNPPIWSDRLKRWFIAPLNTIPEEMQGRSRALATGLFALLLLGLPCSVFFNLISDVDADYAAFQINITIISLVFLGIAYFLSRTSHQNTAVTMALAAMTLPIFLLAVSEWGDVLVLMYLVLPLIVAGVFLPVRLLTMFVTGLLSAIVVLPLLYEDISLQIIFVGPLSVVGTASILVVLLALFRDNLQSAAEQRHNEMTQLQRLLHLSPNMIAVHVDGVFVSINPAGWRLLDAQSADDIIGQPISRFIITDEGGTRPNQPMKIAHGNDFATRTSGRLCSLSGTIIDVEMIAIPIIRGGKLGTQILVQDYTALQQMAHSLKDSEDRYAVISEMVSDYAYALRPGNSDTSSDYELLWIEGSRLEKTGGYTQAELKDWQAFYRLIHPEDIDIANDHWQAVLNGQTKRSDYRIISKSGEVYWMRDHARPRRDEQSQTITSLIAVVQNVTEHLQAEHDLKSHALQQAVVSELGLLALRTQITADSLMQEAITLVTQVLDAEYCVISEYLPKTNVLDFRVWAGWQEDELETYELEDMVMPTSQITYTFQRREAVIVNDIRKEKRFKIPQYIQDKALRSSISVLIHGQQEPIGVLEAQTTKLRHFNLDNLNFLQAIANIVGNFMERERMQTAEGEQRIFAEALSSTATILNSTLELDKVLDHVISYLKAVLSFDAASIMLIEEDEARIIRHTGFESSEGLRESIEDVRFDIGQKAIFGKLTATRKYVIISDVTALVDWQPIEGAEWIRGHIACPIISEGEMIGLINVDSTLVGAFDEKDAQRLQAFADQAAIAIRNAQRATELEQTVQLRTRELEIQTSTLQTIIEATGEGIFYTEDNIILYANEVFSQMLGYKLDEISGKRTVDIIPPEDHSTYAEDRPQMYTALQSGQVWRNETTLQRKDGTTFDAAVTVSLAEIIEGKHRIVCLVRDISEAKQLEAQKSRFISTAAHELRNPISNLSTRLYMVQRDRDNLDRHLMLFEEVIERIKILADNLLDMSSFEHGVTKLDRHDMIAQKLITRVVEVQRIEIEEKGLVCNLDLPAEPIHIFVDEHRMAQVLTNLIVNATHYTDMGSITICLKQIHTPTPTVHIEVQDTGSGISPQYLETIFEPFQRATQDKKGNGLGLSIAREIVTLHGGEISVTSEPGAGSTFTVHLPVYQPGN